MGEPIRIRAKSRDGTTEILVLMPHPMESGFRKNDRGRPIPAHYITDAEVAIAGRTVLRMKMSPAVAQDPLISFRVRGESPGERISVTWIDTAGDRRTDESVIG